jgi:hypothetical protein
VTIVPRGSPDSIASVPSSYRARSRMLRVPRPLGDLPDGMPTPSSAMRRPTRPQRELDAAGVRVLGHIGQALLRDAQHLQSGVRRHAQHVALDIDGPFAVHGPSLQLELPAKHEVAEGDEQVVVVRRAGLKREQHVGDSRRRSRASMRGPAASRVSHRLAGRTRVRPQQPAPPGPPKKKWLPQLVPELFSTLIW